MNGNNVHSLPSHQQAYLTQHNGRESCYKSLHLGQEAKSMHIGDGNNSQESPPAYMNTNKSDTSGSVKYHVLEDTARHQ